MLMGQVWPTLGQLFILPLIRQSQGGPGLFITKMAQKFLERRSGSRSRRRTISWERGLVRQLFQNMCTAGSSLIEEMSHRMKKIRCYWLNYKCGYSKKDPTLKKMVFIPLAHSGCSIKRPTMRGNSMVSGSREGSLSKDSYWSFPPGWYALV